MGFEQKIEMDQIEPVEGMVSGEIPIEPEVIVEEQADNILTANEKGTVEAVEAETPPQSINTDDVVDPTLSDLPEEDILIDEMPE